MTKNNKKLLNKAQPHLPLGVADTYRYWGEDDTIFVEKMQGASITDSDGKEYVDFRLAYGPIILGYRDSRIDEEVIRCINERGTISGFNTDLEAEVVSLIKGLCPNIEKMRFANSGTEAIISAIRTARGFTGRNKILVVEGGFHGLYDEMMWKSDVDNWIPKEQSKPHIIPFGAGIPETSREHVEIIPLNDLEILNEVFKHKGDEIAGVVIEPIMGNCGSISATQEYMQKLRDICDNYGSMLIVDEVKTGFRVAKGGVQELFGIKADLATYAKALGNGYPVAAFGGREDAMDMIKFGTEGVTHGGTYTANMIGLSAAKATLTVLSETDALATVDKTGAAVKEVLSSVFSSFDIEHRFAGPDSMFGVHFGSEIPQNYRDWKKTNSELYTAFAQNLIKNGVMLEPDSREPWFICEAHKSVDLDWLEKVASQSMKDAVEN